jgi:hypothetical protein
MVLKKEGEVEYKEVMKMDKRRFNIACPVCGKLLEIDGDKLVPEHFAVGHINDELDPCKGTGQKGIELKKIWQR